MFLSRFRSRLNFRLINQHFPNWRGCSCVTRLVVLFVAIVSTNNLIADESGFGADYEAPTRSNDLFYGEALYEYHQGRFFEALTVLNVAKEKGGIKQHGDHPLLVEGGLMLAYGMTREAQQHFEQVLSPDMAAIVSDDARNQAWFYLGKVFYLEQDLVASQVALDNVNAEKLLEADEALFLEWRYLKAQISLSPESAIGPTSSVMPGDGRSSQNVEPPTTDLISNEGSLEESAEQNDLWSVYVVYNQALLRLDNGSEKQSVIDGLLKALDQLDLISSYHPQRAGSDVQIERNALRDRIYLSLGQIFLQQKAFTESVSYLQKIPYDSLVSDEALFQYAVAQSNLEQHALALSALNRLKERSLFTPWLQQVPYALAFLYEQLQEPMLAAQAYKAAGDHYEEALKSIKAQQASLNEETIVAALEVSFSFNEEEANDDYLSTERPELQAHKNSFQGTKELGDVLGGPDTDRDAYGRLRVRPSDFYLVNLLATEPFQIALRDLHELYKLQSSLRVWRSRLDSFALMLDTRKAQRERKLTTVKLSLDAQNAELWTKRFEEYKQAIETALSEEDLRFFMDESQIEFAEQIADAKRTLAALPAGEDKQAFGAKLERVEQYFEWWIADRYGVNRWAAQREISKLGEAIEEFRERRDYLQRELENSAFQAVLETRVSESGQRLDELSIQIGLVLATTREQLIEKVSNELERQSVEIAQYRLSSRHAQARLSDQLYRETNNEQAPGSEIEQNQPLNQEQNQERSSETNNGSDESGQLPTIEPQSSEGTSGVSNHKSKLESGLLRGLGYSSKGGLS